MLTAVIVSLFIISIVAIGLVLLKFRNTLRDVIRNQELQQRTPVHYRELTRQVDEIHQTMGGVINSLKAMGHQVHNLNLLAGHALQQQQGFPTDEADQLQQPDQAPQILIELRPRNPEGGEERQTISPEDLPPDMQEKFKTLQALYRAIYAQQPFRTQNRPELN